MRKILEKHQIHYGWVIVALGLISCAFSYGIAHNCFTIYIKPVCEKFGFDRKSFNFCLTLQYIMYMVISMVSGPLFRRFSVKKLMRIAAVVLPVCYFSFSFCRHLIFFYILTFFVGLCLPLLAFQAFTIVISNWFIKKRGTAIGIVFMGSGIGGMIFNALAGQLMEHLGITATYRILAVIIAVVVIPVVYFFVREKPEDMGLLPLGAEERNEADKEKFVPVQYGFTLEEGIRSVNFWLMILLILGIGYSTGALANNIVAHISDKGYSAVYAANMNAIFLGFISVTKILLGMMFDKFGTKTSIVFCFVSLIIGFAGLYFSEYQWMHILLIYGAAVGCASGTVAYPLITQAVCGTKDFPLICGIVMAVGNFGGAMGPFLNNAIYDSCGTYNPVFIAGTVVSVLVILLVIFVRTVKAPENGEQTA